MRLKRMTAPRVCMRIILCLCLCLSVMAGICLEAQAKSKKQKKVQTLSSVQMTGPSGTYVMKAGARKKLSVKLNFTGKGKKPSLTPEWHVSNPKAVKISEDGKLTAIAEGKSKVWASCKGKKSKTLTIIVGQPVSKISLSGRNTLYAGCSLSLQAVLSPETSSVKKLKWISSDSKIASVNSSGKVTGKAEGSVTVSAVSQDGHKVKGSFRIQVKHFRADDIHFIAHRGLSASAPENTLAAYTLAGQAGFWGCECDVWESAPAIPGDPSSTRFAICHNSSLKKMYGVNRNIYAMTPEELSQLTARSGSSVSVYPYEHLPFIEDYLMVCRKYRMHPVIEIKGKRMSADALGRLAATAARYVPLRDVVFISFYHQNLDRIKAALEEMGEKAALGYLYSDTHASSESLKNVKDAIDRAARKGYDLVDVPYEYMNSETAAYASERGVDLIGATTGRYSSLSALIQDLHVSWVFTNKKMFQ